jgi:hypothetical protein
LGSSAIAIPWSAIASSVTEEEYFNTEFIICAMDLETLFVYPKELTEASSLAFIRDTDKRGWLRRIRRATAGQMDVD